MGSYSALTVFAIDAGHALRPDVSFIVWDRYPEDPPPYAKVAPDLAVEVISEGNTKKEIARKGGEYFRCGARLVWEIDPRNKLSRSTRRWKKRQVLGLADTLTGGDVLPGFKLSVAKLFSPPARPKR